MKYLKTRKPNHLDRYRQKKARFAAFVKERREVLLSLNPDRIRDFLRRQGEEEASLMVTEAVLAGACYGIIVDIGLDDGQKAEARAWMLANNWEINEKGELKKVTTKE